MSFASDSSKQRAHSTVLKLYASINLTSFQSQEKSALPKSAPAQLLSAHYEPNKSHKRKDNRVIKTKANRDKLFRKMIKYNVIKKHADDDMIPIEEQKYLAKLRQRNISQIKSLQDSTSTEMQEISHRLLEKVGPRTKRRIRKRLLLSKPGADSLLQDEFDQRVQNGDVEMPGLTPGLAPVDYNESDSD